MRQHATVYQDGRYLARNPNWHTEDSAWKAGQVIAVMTANQLTPSSICEVGCGAGEVLNELHRRLPSHIRFYGYEIAPEAFAQCQSRAKERLEFYQSDLLSMAQSFHDLVLAIDVFEHVEDYMGFLRQLRTMGHHKILHIPLDLSVQTVLRAEPLLAQRQAVGHLHYFTKDTALATLRDTGYEIIDWFYTSGATDLPSRGLKSALLKVPRKLLFAWKRDAAVRLFGRYSMMVLAR
jgi:2-polyprenyl-3-methyl-5-hydroxy-6-metoxy-1,4-benzoquinol methylase